MCYTIAFCIQPEKALPLDYSSPREFSAFASTKYAGLAGAMVLAFPGKGPWCALESTPGLSPVLSIEISSRHPPHIRHSILETARISDLLANQESNYGTDYLLVGHWLPCLFYHHAMSCTYCMRVTRTLTQHIESRNYYPAPVVDETLPGLDVVDLYL